MARRAAGPREGRLCPTRHPRRHATFRSTCHRRWMILSTSADPPSRSFAGTDASSTAIVPIPDPPSRTVLQTSAHRSSTYSFWGGATAGCRRVSPTPMASRSRKWSTTSAPSTRTRRFPASCSYAPRLPIGSTTTLPTRKRPSGCGASANAPPLSNSRITSIALASSASR